MFAQYMVTCEAIAQECLSAEAQAPMLAMLQPVLADMKLIAADSAVHQFEKLLNQFGGKVEHARWLDLKNELTVFCNAQHQADVQAHEDKGCLPENGSSSSLQTFSYAQTDSRVASLQAMSASQKDVFALGDLQQALTLTANGRATDFAARQGVRLAVFIHRAVWLTGM